MLIFMVDDEECVLHFGLCYGKKKIVRGLLFYYSFVEVNT